MSADLSHTVGVTCYVSPWKLIEGGSQRLVTPWIASLHHLSSLLPDFKIDGHISESSFRCKWVDTQPILVSAREEICWLSQRSENRFLPASGAAGSRSSNSIAVTRHLCIFLWACSLLFTGSPYHLVYWSTLLFLLCGCLPPISFIFLCSANLSINNQFLSWKLIQHETVLYSG